MAAGKPDHHGRVAAALKIIAGWMMLPLDDGALYRHAAPKPEKVRGASKR